MESDDKVREVSIKNSTCYYFDDMIKLDFSLDNFFIDEKSCKNNSVYKISHKTLMCAKPVRIRFDKSHLWDFMLELNI